MRDISLRSVFTGLALTIGLVHSASGQLWHQGPINTTTDQTVAFGQGARSVRYMVLHNVTFHGIQDGRWLNDGALFLPGGRIIDPDTGCLLGRVLHDQIIPELVLDYCKDVPLWFAIGLPDTTLTAIYSAEYVEYFSGDQ